MGSDKRTDEGTEENTDESIGESAAINTALRQQVADLRDLIGWLDARHQHVQDVLAAELHDELGSALTALAMRLALIARQAGSAPKLADDWTKTSSLMGNINRTARRVQHQLRPVALEAFGLQAALSDYLEQFGQRTGIACALVVHGPEAALSLSLTLALNQALFRILHEAVENVGKHAGAGSLQVSLAYAPEGFCMTITDDGCGIDLLRLDWQRSHGLRLMRERVALLEAAVEIVSLPGQGCSIKVTLPLVR